MRAKLADLNDGAVPFLSCAAFNLCWYYYTVYTAHNDMCPVLHID